MLDIYNAIIMNISTVIRPRPGSDNRSLRKCHNKQSGDYLTDFSSDDGGP